MGDTRSETPIGSQLVLVSPPSPQNEISLVDLWRVLGRRKGWIFGVFLAVLLSGIVFAFLKAESRTLRATISIGSLYSGKGHQQIENPRTALAKVVESYIPQAVSEVESRDPDYEGRLGLKARTPKDSGLVVIEAEASQEMGDIYTDLATRVEELLAEDHSRILDATRLGLKDRLQQGQQELQNLDEQRSLLEQQFEELVTGENSLAARVQAARTQVKEARARHVSAQGNPIGEFDEAVSRAMESDLKGDEEELRRLEEELRYERDALREEIFRNRGEARAQRIVVADIQVELDSIQETRTIQAPIWLPKPVGPGGKLVVALAGALGLLLGLMAAFFVEFLATVKMAENASESDA